MGSTIGKEKLLHEEAYSPTISSGEVKGLLMATLDVHLSCWSFKQTFSLVMAKASGDISTCICIKLLSFLCGCDEYIFCLHTEYESVYLWVFVIRVGQKEENGHYNFPLWMFSFCDQFFFVSHFYFFLCFVFLFCYLFLQCNMFAKMTTTTLYCLKFCLR